LTMRISGRRFFIVELLVAFTWLFALMSGFAGGIAFTQLVTGRPTYFLIGKQPTWSAGETRVAGLGWTVQWMAVAISALISGWYFAGHPDGPFPKYYVVSIGSLHGAYSLESLMWLPIMLIGPVVSVVVDLHHKRRWPFKRQLSGD